MYTQTDGVSPTPAAGGQEPIELSGERMHMLPSFSSQFNTNRKTAKTARIFVNFLKLTKNRCASCHGSAPIYVMTDKKWTDSLEAGPLCSADDVDQELARDFGRRMDMKD